MQTVVLKVDPLIPDPGMIEEAAGIIKRGGIVAFPTETVYGLAADAFNDSAVRRVYEVKGRPCGKPLPVQVASAYDLDRLCVEVSKTARRLMDAFWPGALTIVLKASSDVPELVTAGTGTVGIRIPDDEVALSLIRAVGGPIVAPSANVSDSPPAVSAEEVVGYFDGSIEMVLDAGHSSVKVASTVVDLTPDELRILREGCISSERIRLLLELG
jgi:L-threonylcarbamoyladenylate synthase